MNNDILIEKIEYLSSLPHSALVKHCIYLENENVNYKAQKYITDFISENGIICEKNKEIERLNNIINEIKEVVDDYFAYDYKNESTARLDTINKINHIIVESKGVDSEKTME